MEQVFIILLAIFGYDVEGIKIRATRTRTIQYLPFKHNQNTHTQTQYIRWLPQTQNTPSYKNSRQTYSHVDPSGVSYNMFSGSGAYAAYMKNNLNRGQTYQSVHQNWPSSAVEDISVDQNRYNSGYKGLIGQSAYQSWRNSASGSPINIPVQENEINSGPRGHIKQTVYQIWQNLGDVGHRGDIDLSLYQNLQNSADIQPNLAAYVEQSGKKSGSIGQSFYQSYDNVPSKRSIDISAKQSGVNPENVTYLPSLQSSAPVNFPADQTILNDQSKYQYFKSAGGEGEINLSVDQSVPNSANGGHIDYFVQQSIPNFGLINYDVEQSRQQSDNGDQAILLLNQGEVDAGHEPQHINKIKVNTNENTVPTYSVSRSDLVYSANESKLNQHYEAPLEDVVKDMKKNSSPIDSDSQNYLISADNGGISFLDQSKQNWPNKALPHNIGKSIHIIREENSPIGAVNENDLKSAETDGIISVHQSKLNWPIRSPLKDIMEGGHINKEENITPIDAETQNYLMSLNNGGILSLDQNKLNEGLLQDIIKEIDINKEENISPIGVAANNDLISSDNEGIISVDQSKLNWPIGGPLQEVMKNDQIDKEKNISTIDAETPNYLLSSNNGGILSVGQSKFNEAPLQDIVKEIDINSGENIGTIGAVTRKFIISPDSKGIISVDQSKLNNDMVFQNIIKENHINNEEDISPGEAVTDKYFMYIGNADSVDESELNGANQDLLKEIQFESEEEISPVNKVSEIGLISPIDEGKITVDQSELNRADQTPLQDTENDTVKNEGNVIQVKDQIKNDLISPDSIRDVGILTGTAAEEKSDPIVPENDLILTNDERVSSVHQTKFNEVSNKFPKILDNIKYNITENSSPVSQIGKQNSLYKNIYGHQTNKERIPIPIYLNILKPNQQLGPIPSYSNILRSNQEQSSAPIIFNPNKERSPVFKTLINEDAIGQQQPLTVPNEMKSRSLQWNKIRNISPQQQQENRDFSSICQNPNTNVIPRSETVYYGVRPVASTQEILESDYLKKFEFRQNPPFVLKPQKIGRYTNVKNTQPIYYKKEMHPDYKAGTIYINRYNIPKPSYYVPTPSQNKFNVQSEKYKTNKNPLQRIKIEANEVKEVTTKASYYTNVNPFYTDKSPDYTNQNLDKIAIYPYYKLVNLNEYNNPQVKYYTPTPSQAMRNIFDIQSVNFKLNENMLQKSIDTNKVNKGEEVITNPSDSRIIYIKSNSVKKNFATENLVPASRLASTIHNHATGMTGYKKPTSKKGYIFEITKALIPELMRLYTSKCDNGYDEKLQEEFKKLVDSIQDEYCKIEI